MSADLDPPGASLIDEIHATHACLAHARRALEAGDLGQFSEVWPRIERCAERVEAMDVDERQRMKPMLLALFDDLEQTIDMFQAALRHVRKQLMSANLGRTADAAYRQMQKP